MIKLKPLACAVALAATPSAAAAEAAATWFVPQPVAAPAEVREGPAEFFHAQPVRYASLVQLTDAYQTTAGTVAAGETLFATEGRKGQVYYCNHQPLRTVKVQDALGLGLRNSLLGAFAGAARMPRGLAWQCFRDTDGDMDFDEVAGGQPASMQGTVAYSVGSIDDVARLQTPLRYAVVEQEPAPMEIGLAALPGRRPDAPRTIVVCHRRTGAEPLTNCFENPKWVFKDKPLTVEVLGGKVRVESISGDVVRYAVEAPISQRFGSITAMQISGAGVAGPTKWMLAVDKK